jgi:hypothetical protein
MINYIIQELVNLKGTLSKKGKTSAVLQVSISPW